MAKLLSVTNAAGAAFNVVLVRRGERYGRDEILVHGSDDPLVEFYDAEYMGHGFGPQGQFVSRYYRSTLLEGYTPGVGLDLCGYEPKWKIDALAFTRVIGVLKEKTNG